MSTRVSTGSPHLDGILGGGVLANSISLLMGPPGSGKTILSQHCLFHNATVDRPAVYLSTVSEPLEKVLRYGRELAFFDPAALGTRVFYEDVGTVVGELGLSGVLDHLKTVVRERKPGLLVIDSFKALSPYAESESGFRRFLYDLAGMLSSFPATTLWVGEYAENEVTTAPEFAVADAIIMLGSTELQERTSRSLRVLKLRGGDFMSGQHSYRLSSAGIEVFPRLADVTDGTGYELGDHRLSSGISALDAMLTDGYWPATSTLVAGPTGVGKTLTGLHFVFHGAHHGEPGVIATLQEDPVQLDRMVQGFGWSLADENVHVMARNPVDLYVDQWVYDLFDVVERTGAKRVMVDSLGDLEAAAPDPVRFREYAYSLLQRCSRGGVSLLTTYEIPDLFGVRRLSETGASHLADNVVVLQYRDDETAIKRTLTVLKTRASQHDHEVREFEITSEGINLVG